MIFQEAFVLFKIRQQTDSSAIDSRNKIIFQFLVFTYPALPEIREPLILLVVHQGGLKKFTIEHDLRFIGQFDRGSVGRVEGRCFLVNLPLEMVDFINCLIGQGRQRGCLQ